MNPHSCHKLIITIIAFLSILCYLTKVILLKCGTCTRNYLVDSLVEKPTFGPKLYKTRQQQTCIMSDTYDNRVIFGPFIMFI